MSPHVDPALERAIGVPALAAATVNNIVGSGIFALPAIVAAVLGPAAILAYLVCAAAMGLVTLCLVEAGSRVSTTGGTYAYVETAFGPYVGFLIAVLFWFGSQALASAAVASLLVDSVAVLVPWASTPIPRATILIAVFGSVALANIRGVRPGSRLIEVVTAAKVAPPALLAVAGVVAGHAANLAWTHVPPIADIARASLVLVFAFMGVETALTPGGEVKDPARTVPRGVLAGLLAVVVLYSALQLATQAILGADRARHPAAPLAAAAERAFGAGGGTLMLVAAIISTFGYICGDMLATPRVVFACARDGFLPSRAGAVHPRFHTPYTAIAIHAGVTCALAITGTFRALAVLSVVSLLLIYLACCLATLELRRRDIRADGPPFRVPGGPAVPLLASAVIVWLLTGASRAEFAAVAAMLVVASVLYRFRRTAVRPGTASP